MNKLILLAVAALIGCCAAQEPEASVSSARELFKPLPFSRCSVFRQNYGWKKVATAPGYLFCMIYRPRTTGCRGNCGTSSHTYTEGRSDYKSCRCCSGVTQRIYPYKRCLRIVNGRIVWQWVRPSRNTYYRAINRCGCYGCGSKLAARETEVFESRPTDLSKETAEAKEFRESLCSAAVSTSGRDASLARDCFDDQSDLDIHIDRPVDLLRPME